MEVICLQFPALTTKCCFSRIVRCTENPAFANIRKSSYATQQVDKRAVQFILRPVAGSDSLRICST
jgi:hypothetical protein